MTVEKIERISLVLLAIGTCVGWAGGLVHVPSFLAGGILMQLNFFLIKKIVSLLLFRTGEGRHERRGAAFLVVTKGLIFLLLLSALFVRYPIEPLSFMAGVSLLVLTCVIVSLFDSWNNRPAVSAKN